jgi:hypothetical protein
LVSPDDGNLKTAANKEILIVDNTVVGIKDAPPSAVVIQKRVPSPGSIIPITNRQALMNLATGRTNPALLLRAIGFAFMRVHLRPNT